MHGISPNSRPWKSIYRGKGMVPHLCICHSTVELSVDFGSVLVSIYIKVCLEHQQILKTRFYVQLDIPNLKGKNFQKLKIKNLKPNCVLMSEILRKIPLNVFQNRHQKLFSMSTEWS